MSDVMCGEVGMYCEGGSVDLMSSISIYLCASRSLFLELPVVVIM